jgi:CelD/BcsL family acetyltransferase involved in cellulose biosynthesis
METAVEQHSKAQILVETITTQDGLVSLERDWNRLSRTSKFPNVFMTFDWFRVWNERFGSHGWRSQRSLNILVLKKDGVIVGISPLIRAVYSRFGFTVRRLEFVGEEGDYNDLVVGDASTGQIEAVVDFLKRTSSEWDVIDLRYLRKAGSSLAQLESALSRARLPYCIGLEEETCPYMLIDAPWAEILGRRSPSTRHVFRNQQSRINRLKEEGLRTRMIENPQGEPRLLERLIAVEAKKRVGGQLVDPFFGRHPDVFQSLLDSLGRKGWISIALMELGERLLAWHLLFRCGQDLWGYQMAYDDDFARLSPGTMLIPAVIDYGFARGFRVYDFLRGEEPYKMRWTTDFRQSHRVQIWNRRWISRLRKFGYFDVRPALYRMLH